MQSAAELNKAKLTSGTIVISKSSNTQLYYKMRANIAGCGRSFFRLHAGSKTGIRNRLPEAG